VPEPLLQAFPFPSTLGEVTLHPLSQASMFIYSSCGRWVFPPSCGVFLPPSLLQAFPLLVAGWVLLLLPSPAWLVYLQFSEGLLLPPPRRSGHPTLFATHLFCCCCRLFIFSFFPWWGLVCPEGYADLAQGCLWEYCMPLSSPDGLPSGLGAGVWQWHRSPPGFSILG
jgi:hypothetical protein